MSASNERTQLLVDIARMYYFDNMSQQQIADYLHMSRSNISLLLKSCMDNNIIEIKINDSFSRSHELASHIKQKYNLKAVLISKSFQEPIQNLESVSNLAANYLRTLLSTGQLLGYTNDISLRMISDSLYIPEYVKVDTVQLMGGISAQYNDEDGHAIARSFQKKLNGSAYVLHAPLMVKSTALRQLLLNEETIQTTMRQYRHINVAAVYIEKPLLIQSRKDSNILNDVDARQLSELGAVCRFCGRYLDANGKQCNVGINDRIIAIDLDCFKNIETVIGIAANVNNAPAVMSCLKSGYINTLIIDEALAKSII